MNRSNPVHGRAVLISLSLGVMMLAFGLLKFINPFAAWYAAQVSASGLPTVAYPLGIATEILAGVLFIGAWGLRGHLRARLATAWTAGSLLVGALMLVATYVHLHPDVPGDVLPLEIWRTTVGARLLPVQERAVKEFGLFGRS